MKTLAKTITHTLAALGLAGAAFTPAYANTDQTVERMTISVSTSDLDLGTAAGQRALDARVKKAVRTVCRTTSPTTGSRVLNMDARACLAKARADAKQQVAALMDKEQRGG